MSYSPTPLGCGESAEEIDQNCVNSGRYIASQAESECMKNISKDSPTCVYYNKRTECRVVSDTISREWTKKCGSKVSIKRTTIDDVPEFCQECTTRANLELKGLRQNCHIRSTTDPCEAYKTTVKCWNIHN